MAQEFGSLNNLMMSRQRTPPTPEVGMGATLLSWTDRYPATVVWVSPSGKTLHLQEDNAERVDDNGMSECQSYRFTPNPAAAVQVARLTAKGWKVVKGKRVLLGRREKYYDYSF
jgi:hypothetical protein